MNTVALPPDSLASGERVLLYVYRFLKARGYSPGAEPVSRALGWTDTNASYHLKQLRRLGWVTWAPGRHSTLTLTERGATQAERIEWCLANPQEARS